MPFRIGKSSESSLGHNEFCAPVLWAGALAAGGHARNGLQPIDLGESVARTQRPPLPGARGTDGGGQSPVLSLTTLP